VCGNVFFTALLSCDYTAWNASREHPSCSVNPYYKTDSVRTNVTLRGIYVSIVVVEKQQVLNNIQCVPLAAEPGISLLILTPMKILYGAQGSVLSGRKLWPLPAQLWCHISYTVRYARFKFRCNNLISGKIIKDMPASVAGGKHCICDYSSAHAPCYVMSSVASPPTIFFHIISGTARFLRGKNKLRNTKCMFWFFLQLFDGTWMFSNDF
jgi:hypothetical protein